MIHVCLSRIIACGGKTPRHFTLSPDSGERWLLCGNQDSATVTVFRRDGASGRLGGPVQSVALDSVMFTLGSDSVMVLEMSGPTLVGQTLAPAGGQPPR